MCFNSGDASLLVDRPRGAAVDDCRPWHRRGGEHQQDPGAAGVLGRRVHRHRGSSDRPHRFPRARDPLRGRGAVRGRAPGQPAVSVLRAVRGPPGAEGAAQLGHDGRRPALARPGHRRRASRCTGRAGHRGCVADPGARRRRRLVHRRDQRRRRSHADHVRCHGRRHRLGYDRRARRGLRDPLVHVRAGEEPVGAASRARSDRRRRRRPRAGGHDQRPPDARPRPTRSRGSS